MSLGKNTGIKSAGTLGPWKPTPASTASLRIFLLGKNLQSSYLSDGNPIPPPFGVQQPGDEVISQTVEQSVINQETVEDSGEYWKGVSFLDNKYGPEGGYKDILTINTNKLFTETHLEYVTPNTIQPIGFTISCYGPYELYTGENTSIGSDSPLMLAALPLFQLNFVKSSKSNVASHYDLSDRLYDLFLDETRQYSCAYFENENDSLTQAQTNKMSRLADKLLLNSNDRVLDIGCGGGLLCEPMARLGAEVLGIDVVEKNIKVASLHAKKMGLDIEYRHISAEDLLKEKPIFDVILNMEVIEHVEHPGFFIEICSNLLNSGGLMFCSTINKNLKSYLFAILGAEYVMQWLPKGTHDWNKFIKPNELNKLFFKSGLKVKDTKGFVFNPISWEWQLSKSDFTVNYTVCATK